MEVQMFSRFMEHLERISDWVNIVSKCVIVVILTAMVAFTCFQVFCRYVFNSALSWPEEMNIFFMAWLTFVGSSIALKQSAHIGVDLFINFLPKKLRRIVLTIGHCLMFAFVILLIRTGYSVAMMNLGNYSEAMELPLIIPRLSLVVGGMMMLVQMIYIFFKDIAGFLEAEEVGA